MDTNTKQWGINGYKLVYQTPWQQDDSSSAYIITRRTWIRINEQTFNYAFRSSINKRENHQNEEEAERAATSEAEPSTYEITNTSGFGYMLKNSHM